MAEPLAIDWRGLLNSLNLPWTDRGPNTSRDNININCPACGDDHGYHMRISEEYEIYNCWRNRRHGGTSFVHLLYQLNVNRTQAIQLLNEFRQSRRVAPKLAAPVEDLSGQWGQFSPLHACADTHPVWKYWLSRGFANPARVAQHYDLRYSPAGRWAMRVLIPMQYDGALRTWTGRSAAPHIQPRYLVKEINDPGQLYIPRPPRDVLYVVEGPLDALKICVAFEGTSTSAVALCSKDLNASRLLRIQRMGCQEVRLLLDGDAPINQQFDMLKTLAASLRNSYVCRWKLPGYKDAGAAPEQELQHLLR